VVAGRSTGKGMVRETIGKTWSFFDEEKGGDRVRDHIRINTICGYSERKGEEGGRSGKSLGGKMKELQFLKRSIFRGEAAKGRMTGAAIRKKKKKMG